MEWSKIKNIILLILLTVNVILLVLVGKREYDSANYLESARLSAVAVLESGGIAVTADLPRESGLKPLQVSWERDEAIELAQASALLGQETVCTDDSGGASVLYSGPGGTATFRIDGSGRFLVELNEGVWEAGEEKAARQGQKCLAALGFDGELVSSDQKAQKNSGSGQMETVLTLTYRQRWEGSPVFSSKAVLTYINGSLRHIEGDRVSGTAAPAGEETILTVPTMLIRFLSEMDKNGYVCSQITGLTAGYEYVRMRLTPVWAITTDNKTTYYLNGMSGLLSQPEA